MPEGVVSRSFCGISGLAPSNACADAGLVRSDLFNANDFYQTKQMIVSFLLLMFQ